MIKLYHYSNKDFGGYIKPDYYANNYYTYNDSRITSVKRSFFYIKADFAEYLLKDSKYLYITEIKEEKIYNITKDVKGYLKRFNGNIDLALRAIKCKYKGVRYNVGYDIVNLFYPVKIKTIKTLTKG